MAEKDFGRIQPEDFVLRVRPYTDGKGSWNGEIDIAIITQPENNLNDEDYFQMMHFCKMMASTVPIMEVNEQLRELVHEYVINVVDNAADIDVELEDNKLVVVKEKDNVVHINFGTKTKGSA